MLHELVRVLGAHDEREVQIVRRLRDEMDLLLLKDFEHWAELVQDRPDTAADECDGGTIADHRDLAELAQVLGERLDRGAVRDVRADVDRDGDVALGRRDQVDGQAVLAKDIEGVGKEADLVPHLHRFHRHERDAVAMRDRLELGLVVARCVGDHAAFPLGVRRALQEQRNAGRAHGRDAARVKDPAPGRCDLLGFAVVQRLDEPRRRNGLRVGAEEAGRIGPDLEPPRLELASEVGARGVRAAAAEQHRLALAVARDEALREHDTLEAREALLERLVGRKFAARRKKTCTLGLIADRRALEVLACVEPFDVEPGRAQVSGAELGRRELTRGEHARMHSRAHLADELHARDRLLERAEAVIEHRGVQAEVRRECVVLGADLVQLVVRIAPLTAASSSAISAFETPTSAE